MIVSPLPYRYNVHTQKKKYVSGILSDDITLGAKRTTVFHNKMFTDAYNNNWLDALAIYLMLFKKYDNKQFLLLHENKNKQLQIIAQDLGISKNTLISKINILKSKGLITGFETQYRNKPLGTAIFLASNKEISQKYCCKKFNLYVDMYSIDTYKKLKYFLKNIPFLSNLSTQKDKCKQHEYFSKIRQEIDLKGNNAFVDYKTYKALLKYEKSLSRLPKSKVENKGLLPNLSLKGISRITNRRSSTTSQRYKNFLIENKVIASYRRSRKLCDVHSREHFEYLKYESKSIPKHSLFSKNSNIAYVYDSSLIFITTDRWSMENMDNYYDSNLRSYVEASISERNAFCDMIMYAKKKNMHLLSPADNKELVSKYGPEADLVSSRMANLLNDGFSSSAIWHNSSIKYENTTNYNSKLTKNYIYKGIINTNCS